MLEHQIYREKSGLPIKICMACAAELDSAPALETGLCDKHQQLILCPPYQPERDFGRGREFQLLRHSDELDDILFRLEYDRDPVSSQIIHPSPPDETGLTGSPLTEDCEQARSSCWPEELKYRIYANYIARLFLTYLCRHLDLASFDYITYADSQYYTMEFIFQEMGYLASEQKYAGLFLSDELHYQLLDEPVLHAADDKRILVLDLYRSYDTRTCVDRLRLSGAREIVTVYLTSYS